MLNRINSALTAGAAPLPGEMKPKPAKKRSGLKQALNWVDKLLKGEKAQLPQLVHIGGELLKEWTAGGIDTAWEIGGSLPIAGPALLGVAACAALSSYLGAKELARTFKKYPFAELDSWKKLETAGDSASVAGGTLDAISLPAAALAGFSKLAARLSASLAFLGTLSSVFWGVEAATEIVLGGKEIVDGFKNKKKLKLTEGIVDIGHGVTALAAIAGGGIPAALGFAVFFAGRIALNHHKKIAKKLSGLLAGE